MLTTEDNFDPDPQSEPEVAPPPVPDPADDAKNVLEELKSLRSEVRESREDAKYWREQATTGKGAKDEAEEEADEEDADIEIDADLVEMVTSGDKQGFARAVRDVAKKSGFVSTKDAQKMIRETATNMSRHATLVDRFPEMEDKDSEFFKETDKHFRRLSAKFGDHGIATIEEAADIAARDLGYEPRSRSRRSSSRDDDDDEPAPRRRESAEDERVSRVNRQQGARTGRSERGEAPALDKYQESMLAKLQAIGAPITRESYTKRASQTGVQVAGGRRR